MERKFKLTLAKARELVKRELGIGTASMEKPPMMNGNPDFPWFELQSGTTRITVYFKCSGKVAYVGLTVAHENSGFSTTEYFYADTLEYATEATELEAAEVFYEKARVYVDNDTVFDPMLRRLGRACQIANDKHFGY